MFLTNNGEIKVDGEIVGIIKISGNTIQDIMIDKPYRNNKYGTKAVGKAINKIKNNNYNYITTTTVVHNGMYKILKKYNFKYIKNINEKEIPRYLRSDINIPRDKSLTPNGMIKIF